MEDLTLDKLQTFGPLWSKGDRASVPKYPRKKRSRKYLVYREDWNPRPGDPEKSRRGQERGVPGKPAPKSDESTNKKNQFSFEKFRSDVEGYESLGRPEEDQREGGDAGNREIPAVVNMFDPFSNNWEIIQEYLQRQKKAKTSSKAAKEELETIQEKLSSVNSSKSRAGNPSRAGEQCRAVADEPGKGDRALEADLGAQPAADFEGSSEANSRTSNCGSWWWASEKPGRPRSSRPSFDM